MIWLLYRHGIKAAQITALGTWHYDHQGRRLTVPPIKYGNQKTKPSDRVIQVDETTHDYMGAWLAARRKLRIGPNPRLFCTVEHSKGQDLETSAINDAIRNARDRAGLDKRVTTHGLIVSGKANPVAMTASIDVASVSPQVGRYLAAGWDKLSAREPDPSGAYWEAVRAVECAAKPVLLPKDRLAHLGKMIAEIRDHPNRYTTITGDIETVRMMMTMLWTEHVGRHATDDEDAPLYVTLEQADVAMHLALLLARMFVAGHVTRQSRGLRAA